MEGKNKLPGKWANFLRDATNKQELFGFISNKVAAMHCPENKEKSCPWYHVIMRRQIQGS